MRDFRLIRKLKYDLDDAENKRGEVQDKLDEATGVKSQNRSGGGGLNLEAIVEALAEES